jgi:signal transduction histidine kinase
VRVQLFQPKAAARTGAEPFSWTAMVAAVRHSIGTALKLIRDSGKIVVSLRAKVALLCSVLLAVAILTVSALETGRASRLMVSDLSGSGDLLVAQTFEQMRAVLRATSGDPTAALRRDPSLRALLSASQAFGKGVSYLRIEDAAGGLILPAPEEVSGTPLPRTYPFADLEQAVHRWWPFAPFWVLWSGRVYETSKAVEINHRPFAVIKVGLSTDLIAAEVRRTIDEIVQIGSFTIALSLLAAMVLSRLLLRPVLALTTSVEQLAIGADEVSVPIASNDEFGALADKFNQLSRRISADRRQWETERGQFVSVLRTITDAILLLDRRGSILFANNEAHGRLGLPAGGVADGKPLTLLLGKAHPLSEMISTAYTLGTEVHDVPIELKNHNERARFLVSISPLGQGPEPPGLLVVVRDLDPVQKLESVVNYSGQLARLGALISGVAHQLRNPLNAMNLQLELLNQDAEAGAPIGPRLGSVRREIVRLDQVLKALLRFMRPEELKLSTTSFNDLVSDVAARTASDPIAVKLDLDPLCPPLMIDRNLVGEAITNVMTNAVEAMPGGGTVTLKTTLNGGESVELLVQDEGQGIPPENLEQIFHLYFTTKERGNGLGLSLAMRAIDLHHGTLDVESTPGQGTAIRIRLPIQAHYADSATVQQEDSRA